MATLACGFLRLSRTLAAFPKTFSGPVISACGAILLALRLGLTVRFIEVATPIADILGLLAQVGIDCVSAGHQFIAGDAHERYKHFTRPNVERIELVTSFELVPRDTLHFELERCFISRPELPVPVDV